MRPPSSSLMCALTSLVSRNIEATSIDVVGWRDLRQAEPDLCRLQTATDDDAVYCTSAQADGFNERQIFAHCNPAILRR